VGEPDYPTPIPSWSSVAQWKRGLDLIDLEIELKSISGAQQIVESQSNLKVIPWLSPGEDTQTLIRDPQTRFFKEQQDARFEHWSGLTTGSAMADYASKLGWLVKAP